MEGSVAADVGRSGRACRERGFQRAAAVTQTGVVFRIGFVDEGGEGFQATLNQDLLGKGPDVFAMASV